MKKWRVREYFIVWRDVNVDASTEEKAIEKAKEVLEFDCGCEDDGEFEYEVEETIGSVLGIRRKK